MRHDGVLTQDKDGFSLTSCGPSKAGDSQIRPCASSLFIPQHRDGMHITYAEMDMVLISAVSFLTVQGGDRDAAGICVKDIPRGTGLCVFNATTLTLSLRL